MNMKTNKELILELLKDTPVMAYPEIVEATGIPMTTVRYTIRSLLLDGSITIAAKGYGHSPTVYNVVEDVEGE